MRRPIRLMSLAALTCAGLLATAPAYAGCGDDTPRAFFHHRPAVGLGVDAGLDLGLGLGLGLNLDLNARVGLGTGRGTGTVSCAPIRYYCG